MKIINQRKIDELQLPFTPLARKELGEIGQRNRPFLVNKTQLAILLQPVFDKLFPSPLRGHHSANRKQNKHFKAWWRNVLGPPSSEKFLQINTIWRKIK